MLLTLLRHLEQTHAATAKAGTLKPSSISPFVSNSFGYFHLETFEDHLLNSPGVTASAGGVTSVAFGPGVHDSVDADDGMIDGSGLNGDSYFSWGGSTGIMFTFNAAALSGLPTRAGLVWTDGGGDSSVTFKAFGPSGNLLYTQTEVGFADFSNNGETAEDRFFGLGHEAGISAIFVSNASGGIEVDHLQYGSTVPEPGTWAMLIAGLGLVGFAARRRNRS